LSVSVVSGQSPGDSDGERAFLQERLKLLAKVVLGLVMGFYFAANLLAFLHPLHSWSAWIMLLPNQLHLATGFIFVWLWWFTSRGPRSFRSLQLADATTAILVTTLLALMSGTSKFQQLNGPALLGAMNALIGRAVIVPSRASRTFWISTVSSIPPVIATYLIAVRFHPTFRISKKGLPRISFSRKLSNLLEFRT
jgi:hypothetical protein